MIALIILVVLLVGFLVGIFITIHYETYSEHIYHNKEYTDFINNAKQRK